MKKLFEDEDDMDETELFRTPIKSKKFFRLSGNYFSKSFPMIAESNLQPYYDDEREQICDTEDDIDDSEDEIVMVNRGGIVRGGDSDSN